jgi:hypothetical protein
MATTTNFGWTTPDDTALVKDGASAIRSLGSSVDSALGQLTLNAQTGTTYTFVLTDNRNKLVTASNASAQTYTIPLNSSVAFPIGSMINIIQIGAGQVTIQGASGVTVASNGVTPTTPKLRVQYSAATLIKVGTDSWYVIGDIAQ